MTITNDDPEIVVGDIGGGDDGAPSAPTQASVIVGEQQTTLPLASAVIATPINNTTATTATTTGTTRTTNCEGKKLRNGHVCMSFD